MQDLLWWIRPQRTRAQRIGDVLRYFWEEHCVPVLLLTLLGTVIGLWVELVLKPWIRSVCSGG